MGMEPLGALLSTLQDIQAVVTHMEGIIMISTKSISNMDTDMVIMVMGMERQVFSSYMRL